MRVSRADFSSRDCEALATNRSQSFVDKRGLVHRLTFGLEALQILWEDHCGRLWHSLTLCAPFLSLFMARSVSLKRLDDITLDVNVGCC